MTTIAEIQALPATDASKLAAGSKIVFRGVSNVVLQVIEGQKSFALGQVYTVETVHNLLGLGHIVKVEGVAGFHFSNLFADLPADFVAPVAVETADVVVDAVKTAETDVANSDAGQKVETVVADATTTTEAAVTAAVTVAPEVTAAVTAVAEAVPAVEAATTSPVAAVEAVATATTAVETAVTAVEDAAPAVEADATATVADATK
jgi:hypothetical protein